MDVKNEDIVKMFEKAKKFVLDLDEEIEKLEARLEYTRNQRKFFDDAAFRMSTTLNNILKEREQSEAEIRATEQEEEARRELMRQKQQDAREHKQSGYCVNKKNGKWCENKQQEQSMFCSECEQTIANE